MNKKTIIGLIIFVVIIIVVIGVAYFYGVFDIVFGISKEKISAIAEEMALNKNGNITSYTFNYKSEDMEFHVLYDGKNNKMEFENEYGVEYIENGYVYVEDSAEHYVNDIVTTWYRTELEGDLPYNVEIYENNSPFTFTVISDLSYLAEATIVKKIKDNVYYVEFSEKYLNDNFEDYVIYGKVTGKVYLNDGYINKVEIDLSNFNLREKIEINITNINSTTVQVPAEITNIWK